jgi:hypothetical protein
MAIIGGSIRAVGDSWRRKHLVAEPDVDLVPEPDVAEPSFEPCSQSMDRALATERLNLDRLGEKLDAVVLDRRRDDFFETSAKVGRSEPRAAEEIDVARRAPVGPEPLAQQESPLEDELAPLVGGPEPVEEALDREQLEQLGERPPRRLRLILEPRQDRVHQALHLGPAHVIASRYGRTTDSTRPMRAARITSAGVKARSSSPFRSASIATSTPIRLRNRKQSTTVFAAP